MRRWTLYRAFSLTELLISVVVLSIIAAAAGVSFQGYQDRTAMLIDETNQKILAEAVKIQAVDTGTVAATLSQLRPRDMEKAYARVTQGGRPYSFFAFLQEQLGLGTAEAVPLPPKYYNDDKKTLTCPVDPHNPLRGDGVSYAINSNFRDKPLSVLLKFENRNEELIYECKDDGQTAEFRHGGKRIAVVTTVKGKRKRKESGTSGGGGQHP